MIEHTMSDFEKEMIGFLEAHVAAEMQGDLEGTMATMSEQPHLLNVANMMGGDDYEG
jgi:carboxymethylenebutenolidase